MTFSTPKIKSKVVQGRKQARKGFKSMFGKQTESFEIDPSQLRILGKSQAFKPTVGRSGGITLKRVLSHHLPPRSSLFAVFSLIFCAAVAAGPSLAAQLNQNPARLAEGLPDFSGFNQSLNQVAGAWQEFGNFFAPDLSQLADIQTQMVAGNDESFSQLAQNTKAAWQNYLAFYGQAFSEQGNPGRTGFAQGPATVKNFAANIGRAAEQQLSNLALATEFLQSQHVALNVPAEAKIPATKLARNNFTIGSAANFNPAQAVSVPAVKQVMQAAGEVLSASTTKPTRIVSTPAVKSSPTVNVKQEVDAILNQYLAQGKFVGPAGPSGPPGLAGPTTVVDDDQGNSTVIISSNPIVSYFGNAGISAAGFGELSATDFMTTTLTASGPSSLWDVVSSGSGTFAGSLAAGGPISAVQSVTITGDSSGAADLILSDDVNGYGGIDINSYGNSDSPHSYLNLSGYRGTSTAATALLTDDELGQINFYGQGTAGNALIGAKINSTADSNFGTSTAPGNLIFTTNGTEAMRITSAAKVGIGTSTPGSALTVAGDINYTGSLYHNGALVSSGATASGTPGNIEFMGSGTSLNANQLFNWDNANLKFSIGTTSTSSTLTLQGKGGNSPLLTVASSSGASFLNVLANGNVGIATANPGGPLYIQGNTTGRALGLINDATTNASQIRFVQNGAQDTAYTYITGDGRSTGYLRFSTNDTERVRIDNSGNVGINTSTPLATLDVEGSLNINSGAITYSTTTLLTTIDNLQVGASSFETDAGIVTWEDMPVTASSTAGTVESYRAQINGTPILTVYSTADGSGGISGAAVGIGTTTPTSGPLVMASGAYVTTGGTWTNASDRSLKTNFTDVDPINVLQKINLLDIQQWNYKVEATSTTHIGPVAQDFYQQFHLGGNDTSISTIDPAGVALLGIQGLSKIFGLQGSLTYNISSNTPITIARQVNFGGDSVGQAKILAGSTSVRVSFAQNYSAQPIVTITPLDFVSGPYRVTMVDATGFTIEFAQAQIQNMTFDWHAFGGAGSKLTVSDGSTKDVVLVLAAQPEAPPQSGGAGSPPPANTPPPDPVTASTTPETNSSSTPPSDSNATSTPQ